MEKLNKKEIIEIIESYKEEIYNQQKKQRIYTGEETGIQNKVTEDYINNKVSVNFAKTIVDTVTSYLVGIPPSITHKDKEVQKEIDKIIFNSNFNILIMEAVRESRIKGKTGFLCCLNEDGEMYIQNLKADEFIVIRNTRTQETECIIRFYDIVNTRTGETEEQKIEVYYKDIIQFYSRKKRFGQHLGDFTRSNKGIVLEEEIQNPFGKIPIVQLLSDAEGAGDITNTLVTQQNAYNLLNSLILDNVEKERNAIWVFKGYAKSQEEDLQDIRYNSVFFLDSDGDLQIKNNNIDIKEKIQMLKYLREDIFLTSGTPLMTDELFGGNQSGVAIKMKYKRLDDKVNEAFVRLEKAILNIFNVFLPILELKTNKKIDILDFEIILNKNIVQNELEKVNLILAQLGAGLISKQTAMQELGINPNLEMEKIQEEDSRNVNEETKNYKNNLINLPKFKEKREKEEIKEE